MSEASASARCATPRPCGTWESPITPSLLVAGAVGIAEVVPEPDGSVWWTESRPTEGGRIALMRHTAGQSSEVTSPTHNVRSAVHEYGGGAWWAEEGVAWCVDYGTQRLFRLEPGKPPVALTPEPDVERGLRFADCRPTPDGLWLIGVCERHSSDPALEPDNLLVAIANDGSMRLITLSDGADFVGSPRVSPDGASLAWIEWDHPNMPWDETRLCRASLDCSAAAISIDDRIIIAGGPGLAQAIQQPEWSPEGVLHWLSDKGDTWQLYNEHQDADEPVFRCPGEIGYPPWVFGLSRYAFRADGTVVAAYFKDGFDHLDGYPVHTAFHSVRIAGNHLAVVAASFSEGSTVFLDGEPVRSPPPLSLDPALFGVPERLHFSTSSRNAGDVDHAHALYYAPANPRYSVATSEKPPLIVLAHGGPTSAARSEFNLARCFWTSRGFAVVDVNYRGSSGFGRRYRRQLDGEWGIVDVADCVAAARYLVERGDVDPGRLIIRGGSAGGFTVLSALAFHDLFTAGASLYGVADLETLAADTHKFESRYLDSLIGPWPEAKARYHDRSPIHHLDGFTAPMIVLQGSEDRVVPPEQSRRIVEALDERGVPVAYLEFEGEQHGFRKADTLIRALEAELAFYGRVFGFQPAGEPIELDIRNLGDSS